MTEQELEILEAYVLGNLEKKESAEVEQRLLSDDEWQSNLKKMGVLKALPEKLALRNKIKAIHQEVLKEWEQESPKKGKIISWPKIAVAGIAASVATFIYFNQSHITLPGQLIMQERGSDSNISESDRFDFQKFKDAQAFLISGKNQEAAEAFAQIKNEEHLRKYYRDLARWLEVVALAEIDKPKAAQLLREIESDDDFKYKIPYFDKIRLKTRLLF